MFFVIKYKFFYFVTVALWSLVLDMCILFVISANIFCVWSSICVSIVNRHRKQKRRLQILRVLRKENGFPWYGLTCMFKTFNMGRDSFTRVFSPNILSSIGGWLNYWVSSSVLYCFGRAFDLVFGWLYTVVIQFQRWSIPFVLRIHLMWEGLEEPEKMEFVHSTLLLYVSIWILIHYICQHCIFYYQTNQWQKKGLFFFPRGERATIHCNQ